MTKNSQEKLLKEVTCPFCSLLCDDLEIKHRGHRLKVAANGCPKAIRGFEYKTPALGPHIHGEACSLDEAINHAADILARARHPLISGLGTDVAGSRAAMGLAEATGAIIDHGQSDGIIRNALVMQSGGWIQTTLAELKNRADLIVFIGTDLNDNYPRFYERFIWEQPSLFGLDENGKEIIYIGHKLNPRSGINPNGRKPTVVNCDEEILGDTIAILRTLLKDIEIQPQGISRKKLSLLRKVAENILKAEYGVFVWAPGELNQPHSELVIQSICEMVKELNQVSRYAGLALGGSNGGASFLSVCTWQSGYPSCVSYAQGYPEYDPYQFSCAETLKNTEADALLWVSSFHQDLEPPATSIPTIILSRPSRKNALDAEVYLPVGTPGLDHAGNLFRTDNIVNLPLKQLREPTAPQVAEMLGRILRAL